MNNDMEYVEKEYNDQNKQIPWLKIVIIICAIILALIIFFSLKGCSDKNYTITFDTNGGSEVNSQTISKGDYIIKPVDPIKEGYTFNGWYYNNNLYDFNNEVSNNMTLTARWEEFKVLYYLVTFDSVGGSYVEAQEIKENKTVVRPTDPVKLGYTFEGWYLDDIKYDFESRIISDIILTAKWKSTSGNSSGGGTSTGGSSSGGTTVKPTKYTVAFNSNGGTAVSIQTITSGGKVSKPANPTRPDYKFEGWYYNGYLYDFNTPVTKNITLIAKWSDFKNYIVTFNSNGGSEVPSKSVLEGNKVIKPVDPVKANHVFEGWYLNEKPYDFNSSVNTHITLTAKWKENEKYTVTFNTNGGSNIANQPVYKNNKLIKPQAPTRNNYTFEGWYYNGKEFNFNTPITSNITLIASWKPKYDFNFTTEYYGLYYNPDASYNEIIRLNRGRLGIVNVNLPSGYKIEFQQDVSISGGSSMLNAYYDDEIKKGMPFITITESGIYTVNAIVNGEIVATKKIFAYSLCNFAKEYQKSIKLSDIPKIEDIYTYDAKSTVTFDGSKLFISTEGTRKMPYCFLNQPCNMTGGVYCTAVIVELD